MGIKGLRLYAGETPDGRTDPGHGVDYLMGDAGGEGQKHLPREISQTSSQQAERALVKR